MNARVTVIQRAFNKTIIDEYLPDYAKRATPCGVFEEGQTFDIAGPFPSKPDGFCDRAWADIHRNVAMACLGAQLPPEPLDQQKRSFCNEPNIGPDGLG